MNRQSKCTCWQCLAGFHPLDPDVVPAVRDDPESPNAIALRNESFKVRGESSEKKDGK